MKIDIEILRNTDKDTFTVINLETGETTSLQGNAARGLTNIFKGITKPFANNAARQQYIREVRKEIRERN